MFDRFVHFVSNLISIHGRKNVEIQLLDAQFRNSSKSPNRIFEAQNAIRLCLKLCTQKLDFHTSAPVD